MLHAGDVTVIWNLCPCFKWKVWLPPSLLRLSAAVNQSNSADNNPSYSTAGTPKLVKYVMSMGF